MFRVTTLDLSAQFPKTGPNYQEDFFGRETSLTVSGQLEAELFAMALTRVYTFGPTFRAENSNTSRHLAEFWMIEPEMAFYDLKDNMDLAEEFVKFLMRFVLESCQEEMQFFERWIQPGVLAQVEQVEKAAFERITYGEAIGILQKAPVKFEYPVLWGADLQAEHERFLTEQHFKRPVFVSDYPKEIKAFYMRQNDDHKTVAAMDLLVPGLGEIIGGSQREEREDVLRQRLVESNISEADYWWYVDIRRFGTAPHSGFGLGFERTMMYFTGMSNIRDVIPFPRYPGHADF